MLHFLVGAGIGLDNTDESVVGWMLVVITFKRLKLVQGSKLDYVLRG